MSKITIITASPRKYGIHHLDWHRSHGKKHPIAAIRHLIRELVMNG